MRTRFTRLMGIGMLVGVVFAGGHTLAGHVRDDRVRAFRNELDDFGLEQGGFLPDSATVERYVGDLARDHDLSVDAVRVTRRRLDAVGGGPGELTDYAITAEVHSELVLWSREAVVRRTVTKRGRTALRGRP